jgi:site-specific recombinase XerD
VPELTVVRPTTRTHLETLIDDYLDSRRARGRSPRTIAAYVYGLKPVLLPFAKREGITGVDQLTTRKLEKLTAELLESNGRHGKPLSKASVRSYVKTINLFLGWALKDGQEVKGSAPVPSVPRKIRDTLSRAQIDTLEDTAATERDKLIVRLLADTGMRVGELCSIRTSSVIQQEQRGYYIKVTGKGSKDRLIPLGYNLARRLKKYIDHGRPKDARTDHLFLSERRSPRSGQHEPLNVSGVLHLMRLLGEKAELPIRSNPHMLRHSFATWALRQHMDSIQLARILGHASLAMLQRNYAHLTSGDDHGAMMELLQTRNGQDN